MPTLIVFGKDTLITRLPQDYQIQYQLVLAGLVFDSNGGRVSHMPDEGVWPESYYCIPFAGLTNLLFTIADVLKDKNVCNIEFAFADPVYVGHDVAMRDVLTKCLRAVFGRNMPGSFDQAYWQTKDDKEDTLVGLSQAQYLAECETAGITALLDRYKSSQELNAALPDDVAYFYVNGNDPRKFDQDRIDLKLRIDSMKSEPTRNILLDLNILRLRQSVMSLLSVLKDKYSAEKVIFITSNIFHRQSAQEAGIGAVYTPDIVSKIVDGERGVPCLLANSTVQFLVETILNAVGSPFPVFAAYMRLLQQQGPEPVAFENRYFGAHLLITHHLFLQAFEQTNRYNHEALNKAFESMSIALENTDPNAILAKDQMQRHIEFLIARFTGHLRGRKLEQRVSLEKIIPAEIIAAFAECQKIVDDADILWRVFLMWCSSQLQNFEAGTTGGLSHFIKVLAQIVSSNKEELELVDRIDACMVHLIQVLSGEIEKYQNRGEHRQSLLMQEVEKLSSHTPTRSAAQKFTTPHKQSSRRIRLEAQGAEDIAEMPRSRGGSASSALDISMPLQDLREELVLTEEELRNVRVDVFLVPTETNVKNYLEKRVRLAGHEGRNVSLYYANQREAFLNVESDGNTTSEEELRVVAIGYCNPETREAVYYRRAAEESDNKKLRKNRPLTNLPIFLVRAKVVGGKKEIQVIWGASLTDVYIGKENPQIPTMPNFEIQPAEERALLGQIDQKIRTLLVDPRLKQFAHEILTAFANLGLVSKEDIFLNLDVSGMEGDVQQLVGDMRTAYEFISGQQVPGLFALEVTPTGIKAEIDSRGEKLLSMVNLGLNVGAGVILLSLIFGFKNSAIGLDPGDVFFYRNKLIAELFRAAILTVYAFTPLEVVKQATGYFSKLWAQIHFGRQLRRLPRNIPAAIVGGSMSQQTMAAKLGRSLEMLADLQQDILPSQMREFLSVLHAVALISEESKLPPELRLIFMNAGKEVGHAIARDRLGSDKSSEQMAIEMIREVEKKHLRVAGSVTLVSGAVAVIFAGIYYSLINTNGDADELSKLTRSGLYAVGIAALYLLYRFGGSVAEASIGYAANQKASLFGSRNGNREAVSTLRTVQVVNDKTAAGERDAANTSADATATTPLLPRRSLPRPGRGCHCVIS